MKRKFTFWKEIQDFITPDERLFFLDSSPFSEISLPPRSVTVALQCGYTMRGVCGTSYAIRHDSNDTVLLKTYVYPFNGDFSQKKILIDTYRSSNYEHHHIDDLPVFMKTQAPRALLNRIEEIRQGNLADSNFLQS